MTLGVHWRNIKTFHDLMKVNKMTPASLLEAVERNIDRESYSKEKIMVCPV